MVFCSDSGKTFETKFARQAGNDAIGYFAVCPDSVRLSNYLFSHFHLFMYLSTAKIEV